MPLANLEDRYRYNMAPVVSPTDRNPRPSGDVRKTVARRECETPGSSYRSSTASAVHSNLPSRREPRRVGKRRPDGRSSGDTHRTRPPSYGHSEALYPRRSNARTESPRYSNTPLRRWNSSGPSPMPPTVLRQSPLMLKNLTVPSPEFPTTRTPASRSTNAPTMSWKSVPPSPDQSPRTKRGDGALRATLSGAAREAGRAPESPQLNEHHAIRIDAVRPMRLGTISNVLLLPGPWSTKNSSPRSNRRNRGRTPSGLLRSTSLPRSDPTRQDTRTDTLEECHTRPLLCLSEAGPRQGASS